MPMVTCSKGTNKQPLPLPVFALPEAAHHGSPDWNINSQGNLPDGSRSASPDESPANDNSLSNDPSAPHPEEEDELDDSSDEDSASIKGQPADLLLQTKSRSNQQRSKTIMYISMEYCDKRAGLEFRSNTTFFVLTYVDSARADLRRPVQRPRQYVATLPGDRGRSGSYS